MIMGLIHNQVGADAAVQERMVEARRARLAAGAAAAPPQPPLACHRTPARRRRARDPSARAWKQRERTWFQYCSIDDIHTEYAPA